MIYILASSIVILDLVLLLRNKDNKFLLLFNFIILYFNYSICFGVYLLKSVHVDSVLDSYKGGELYTLALILLFIFTIIRFIFFFKKIPDFQFPYKSLPKLYYISIIILLYVAIFEINREASVSYTVKISPLYEYSFVFFMLALYFQPKNRKAEIILYALAILIIGQDFYYGGRVSSLQILLVFAIMKFKRFITLKNLVVPFVLLNIIFTLVGVYRENYTLSISIGEIFDKILNKLFISDTVVYAYFASITHLYMFDHVNLSFILESLLSFISLIFLGGSGSNALGLDLSKAYLTDKASSFHWNAGGGVFFSNFYFWFGPYLYTICLILFFKFLRRTFLFSTRLSYFSLVIILVALPRWYLYSPLALFRGVFFMLPIIWFAFTLINLFVYGKKRI